MSKHDVDGYELNGNEFDVMHKLYWSGFQEDGDLPSITGMLHLIDKGLAERTGHQKRNQLTKEGYRAARKYFKLKNRFV